MKYANIHRNGTAANATTRQYGELCICQAPAGCVLDYVLALDYAKQHFDGICPLGKYLGMFEEEISKNVEI